MYVVSIRSYSEGIFGKYSTQNSSLCFSENTGQALSQVTEETVTFKRHNSSKYNTRIYNCGVPFEKRNVSNFWHKGHQLLYESSYNYHNTALINFLNMVVEKLKNPAVGYYSILVSLFNTI